MIRMKMTPLVAFVLLCACGKSGQLTEAEHATDIATGDAQGKPLGNSICNMYSLAELATYVGEPVKSGENAAMGKGCNWAAEDDDGAVTIAVVPAEFEERATAAKGFRKVPEVGKDGFVVPDLGGWVAGAVARDSFYRVTISGKKASDANALALLRETIKRVK